MTLGQRQEKFMRLLPELLIHAHDLGYQLRGGDLFRDPRSHGEYCAPGPYGEKCSLHKLKCAIDLNLFKDGVYLDKTEDHKMLGEYWELLDEKCRWGGNHPEPDGNHYELLG